MFKDRPIKETTEQKIQDDINGDLLVRGVSRILHEHNSVEFMPPLIEWCGLKIDRYDVRALLSSPLDLRNAATSSPASSLSQSPFHNEEREAEEERLCDVERYRDLDSQLSSSPIRSALEETKSTSQFFGDFHAVPYRYESSRSEANNSENITKDQNETNRVSVSSSADEFDSSKVLHKINCDCLQLVKTLEEFTQLLSSSTTYQRIETLLSLISSEMREQIAIMNEKLKRILEEYKQKNAEIDTETDKRITKRDEERVSSYRPPLATPPDMQLPPDEFTHQIIARTAQFIQNSRDRQTQIQNLLDSQKDNPNFAFLQSSHPLHPYFLFLMLSEQERTQLIIKRQYEVEQQLKRGGASGTKLSPEIRIPLSRELSPQPLAESKSDPDTVTKLQDDAERCSFSGQSPASLSYPSSSLSAASITSEKTLQQISRKIRAKEFLQQIALKEQHDTSSTKRKRSSSPRSSHSSSSSPRSSPSSSSSSSSLSPRHSDTVKYHHKHKQQRHSSHASKEHKSHSSSKRHASSPHSRHQHDKK